MPVAACPACTTPSSATRSTRRAPISRRRVPADRLRRCRRNARQRPEFERNHRAVDFIIRLPATTDMQRPAVENGRPDGHRVVDLRHRRDRVRVRYLRAADAAAHRRAGARRADSRQPGHPGVRRLGRAAVLRAGGVRRRLRPARRLPHRSTRPPARARRGASCSTRSRRSRPATRRASTGCSCSAARRSSACASSSSRRRPGSPSCSPIRGSASACSATRRRSGRSAA